MRRIFFYPITPDMTRKLSVSLTAALLAGASVTASSASYLIEGEAFQFKGKWVVEKSSDCLGSAMLRVYQDSRSDAADDALTVVNIAEAGHYRVWTRSQDFVNSARPRTYTLTVDGKEMRSSGAHGSAGFRWELVGEADLTAKPTLMRLADTGLYFGRCDAILLTTDASLDPNTRSNTELARYRRAPAVMDYSTDNAPRLADPLDITAGYTVLATVANDSLRVSFVRLAESGAIVCKTDFYAAGSWRRFGNTAEDNRVALISNAGNGAVTFNHNQFYPAWNVCAAERTFTFDNTDYAVKIDGDSSNPFFAGTLTEARAAAVSKTAADCIKVTYDCGDAGTLTGYWTIADSGPYVGVRLVFKPAVEGTYSLALHGAKGVGDASATGGLMPPMFAGKRLPQTPLMLFSSQMSQCLAAVGADLSFGPATSFVSADLDTFGDNWGGYDHSPVGFTLRNSAGELQPVAFSPLPGMADSKVKANRTVEARFIAGIVGGYWADALEYVSDNVFEVGDYRRPDGCSLSRTARNIIDLIADDEFSGWAPALKGFWDIEADGNTAPTVVQSSPLAVIGAALLTADADLYERRALPTIEYLLSRNGYRTRANAPQQLDPTQSQFPTTLFAGINTLTGGLNPWLADLALPGGATRASNGYFSTLQQFSQEIAAMRLTGDDSRLGRARELADAYVGELMADNLPDMAAGSFYNSQMTPDWTPLLDIYALTGDECYLRAAEHGAAHTLAGIKSWPRVADGDMTVHPGGVFDGVTTIWWKGSEQFRLGFPRTEGDAPEHLTEAWRVSAVGLGMEQPATYFVRTAGKTVRPVFMNSRAPRLLELSAAGGKAIFETYARNAVIGRSANYPGYYATGYTDLTMSEEFPYKGPDVSSIYYHHIPAHLAMIQDFLVSEATTRSNGSISVEPARQEGFVWFTNNVYGASRGRIDDADVRLYMPRNAVGCSNPDINVLTARSDSQFFIILTNDGDDDTTASLTLGNDIARRTGGNPTLTAKVAARDLTVLTLDADFSDLAEAPALTDGMHVIDTGTAAGTVYLYRIRSPFGYDSLYGFAGCGEVSGLTVTARCNGAEQSAATWPYEWSLGNVGYDDSAEVTVSIAIGGTVVKTLTHTFATDDSAITDISVASGDDCGDNRLYTLDGRRVGAACRRGIYIARNRKIVL